MRNRKTDKQLIYESCSNKSVHTLTYLQVITMRQLGLVIHNLKVLKRSPTCFSFCHLFFHYHKGCWLTVGSFASRIVDHGTALGDDDSVLSVCVRNTQDMMKVPSEWFSQYFLFFFRLEWVEIKNRNSL